MKMKRMNKLGKQGLIEEVEINELNNKIHNCGKKRFEAGYTRNWFTSSSDFFFEPVCVYHCNDGDKSCKVAWFIDRGFHDLWNSWNLVDTRSRM